MKTGKTSGNTIPAEKTCCRVSRFREREPCRLYSRAQHEQSGFRNRQFPATTWLTDRQDVFWPPIEFQIAVKEFKPPKSRSRKRSFARVHMTCFLKQRSVGAKSKRASFDSARCCRLVRVVIPMSHVTRNHQTAQRTR